MLSRARPRVRDGGCYGARPDCIEDEMRYKLRMSLRRALGVPRRTDAHDGIAVRMPGMRPTRLQAETARQILEILRRDGLSAGHHLTEEGLAARLGVSRTPIRAALRILAQNGFLVARPRQGYVIAPRRAARGGSALLPASADDELYMRVARDLVRKRLPASFTETSMMRRYGASRSLAVTVLARMSEEGLVRRGRGREWLSMPFLDSQEEQTASYDFRLILEPAALRLATFQVDRAALAEARRRHALLAEARSIALSSAELFELDATFHALLARMSRNAFFLSAIEQQNRLRRLIEYWGYRDRTRLRAWCREHLQIIDALLAGDRAKAAALLERHLGNARRQLLKGPAPLVLPKRATRRGKPPLLPRA